MDEKYFKKLVSRVLRHSGLTTKINRSTRQYELYHDSSPEPVIYAQPIIEREDEQLTYYLCFTFPQKLDQNIQNFYNRIINRFTRLAPSLNITTENLDEPIFDDQQMEIIEQLVNENKGESDETREDC